MKTFHYFLTALLLPQATTSTSAGGAALAALKSMDYRYFVAGGTCAAISHGITTPIDVVKTRIQANPKVSGCLVYAMSIRYTSNGKDYE
jgi:solute carrier family 25 phosphate transporter 3